MKKIYIPFLLSILALFTSLSNGIAQTTTFGYTGAVQTYTVPPGVTSIVVDAEGAAGGQNSVENTAAGTACVGSSMISRQGYGGCVVCTLSVTPGQVLQVFVGGQGQSGTCFNFGFICFGFSGNGGYNGGGNGRLAFGLYGGGGGGGASDVRLPPYGAANRVVVAGGGGGAGCNSYTSGFGASADDCDRGGDGGATPGEAGYANNGFGVPVAGIDGGGGGGAAGAGGAGGTIAGFTSGAAGNITTGGNGGNGTSGGGGGGGFWGGGGGCWEGGGGGSNYTSPTLTLGVVNSTRGCNTTGNGLVTITPNCDAGVIVGPANLCTGTAVVSYSDAVTGGTWSSGSTGVATISATGNVTAISAGTTILSYAAGGCWATQSVTVYETPTAILGTPSVCVGATTVLGDGILGGVWSSSSTGVGTIGSGTGIVTGVSGGSTTVTYATGGGLCYVTAPVTVNSNPAGITGDSIICQGSSSTLYDATAGGTWSSATTSVAVIGSGTGAFTGIGFGSSVITYSLTTTGCYTTTTVTVNKLPSIITGGPNVCVDSTIQLQDSTFGGTWSTTATNVILNTATGQVTGVSAGPATITYFSPTGCFVTTTITVGGLPAAISGSDSVCAGSIVLYTDPSGSGTWISSNPGVASVGVTSGDVSGVTYGTATIYFINSSGCSAAQQIQVDSLPSAIAGPSAVCVGATATLTDVTAGGTWSSSNTTIASVNASTGVVTGNMNGTVVINYTSISGCVATASFTVNGLPEPIAGGNAVCYGGTVTLSDAVGGGTWTTTSGGAVAAIGSSSGIVTGVAVGPDTVVYTLGTGCSVSESYTVNPLPAPIDPVVGVCATEGTTTITDAGTPGGSWSCAPSTVATINAGTGVLTGVGTGDVIITYSLPTGCYVTTTDTVYPLPGNIVGATSVCLGSTTTLLDAVSGGSWSSTATSVATISGSGVLYGASTGSTIVSYTLPTGCYVYATENVDPLPSLIFGADSSVCVGSNILLFDTTAGGGWTTTNGNASVDPSSGTVTGNNAGLDSVIYTLGSTGCTDTLVITIHPLPQPITGALIECGGLSASLYDASSGGSWSCSPSTLATINSATGVVTGVSGGLATVTYTLPTGCLITAIDTTLPDPAHITGPEWVCSAGYMVSLSDDTLGGTWSSNNTAIATVSSTGTVVGVTAGTTYITYSVGTGCYTVDTMIVYPVLVPVVTISDTPSINICAGTPDSFTVTNINGGTSPVYQWYVNSVPVATGTGYDYVPTNGDVVSVTMISSAICAHPDTVADAKTMNILPIVIPGVTVSTPAGVGDTVCVGTAITFTATPQNGGPTPSYQWTVNWAAVGTDSANYTYVPMNGDIIRCRMTSDSLCAIPDTANGQVIVTVSDYDTPRVHIWPNVGDTVCEGTMVTYSVIPTFGGYTPLYWWTLNGVNVSTGSTYTFIPGNGDSLKVTMISDYPCKAEDTATETIRIYVDSIYLPVVHVSQQGGYIVYPGGRDTFTATILSGGGLNPSYQWYQNSVPVAGATTSVFIDSMLGEDHQKDSIACVVTNNDLCNGVQGFDYEDVWVGYNVGTPIITAADGSISIIPNPNTGYFIVKGTLGSTTDEDVTLEVTDMLGRTIYLDKFKAVSGRIDRSVQLGATLANGVYIINVTSGRLQTVLHMVLDK